MKSFTSVIILSLLVSAQASVLSATDIATVLAGATSQSSLTIPPAVVAAIAKLRTRGANNNASKAGLGGGTGSAGN